MAEKSRPRAEGSAVNARGVGAGASASMAGAPSGTAADRRKRVALRRLIDEMLAEIRAAANEENWTNDARAQAESDARPTSSTAPATSGSSSQMTT